MRGRIANRAGVEDDGPRAVFLKPAFEMKRRCEYSIAVEDRPISDICPDPCVLCFRVRSWRLGFALNGTRTHGYTVAADIDRHALALVSRPLYCLAPASGPSITSYTLQHNDSISLY